MSSTKILSFTLLSGLTLKLAAIDVFEVIDAGTHRIIKTFMPTKQYESSDSLASIKTEAGNLFSATEVGTNILFNSITLFKIEANGSGCDIFFQGGEKATVDESVTTIESAIDSLTGVGNLQSVTDQGNTTTNDIVQLGGKVVAPEFETSGASLKLSQRVTEKAFGTFEEITDEIMDTRALQIKVPVTSAGTDTPIIPVVGLEFSLTPQPVFTDVFTGNIFTPADFLGTGNFITNQFTFRFQDAGKLVKLRVQADTGSGVFDLFGTSEDPYLHFVTVSGLNVLNLSSPIPTNMGVNYMTVFEEETGAPLNMQGDNSVPPFDHFRSFLAQPFAEEPYSKLGDRLTTELNASSFSNQEPSGTDSPLQIEFGAAQNGPTDPVELDVNGTITFNEEAMYLISINAEYGRSGSPQESQLRFRAEINGTPVDPVLAAVIENSADRVPLVVTFLQRFFPTNTLELFILRDSSGHDSGGLFSNSTTLAGWDNSPSARVLVERFF